MEKKEVKIKKFFKRLFRKDPLKNFTPEEVSAGIKMWAKELEKKNKEKYKNEIPSERKKRLQRNKLDIQFLENPKLIEDPKFVEKMKKAGMNIKYQIKEPTTQELFKCTTTELENHSRGKGKSKLIVNEKKLKK